MVLPATHPDKELKDASDDDVFKAREKMDEDIQVAEDNWKKYEEAAAFYANLRATVECYYEENVDYRDQTNKLMKKTMNHLNKISQAGVDERVKLLKTLNRVFETLEADFVLKEAMKKMAETNNTTFGNLTSLTELHKNAQLPKILTELNAFQTSLNTFSSQCTSISNSLKKESKFYQRLVRDAKGYI
ncbi:hypothetical protein Tco_1477986 [Tanacetum coccineum]